MIFVILSMADRLLRRMYALRLDLVMNAREYFIFLIRKLTILRVRLLSNQIFTFHYRNINYPTYTMYTPLFLSVAVSTFNIATNKQILFLLLCNAHCTFVGWLKNVCTNGLIILKVQILVFVFDAYILHIWM